MNTCPVCGHNTEYAFTVPFMNGKPLMDKILRNFDVTYDKCQNCGLHYSVTQRDWGTSDFAEKCYNDDYYHYDGDINDPQGSRPRFHETILHSLFSRQLESHLPLLDYGCGKGFVVTKFKTNGYTIQGYDPFYGEYNTTPDSKFHAITALEVLEHTYNIIDMFKMFYNLLIPGGVVFATTDLTDKMQDIKTNYYTCPRVGHVMLYSKKTLNYVAEETKFNLLYYTNPYSNINNSQCYLFIKR